jgi:carboxylesterase
MIFFKNQIEKPYKRNKSTNIIFGAEPFEFGRKKHAVLFIHGWTSSPRDLKFLAEKMKYSFHCKGILLEGHGLKPEKLEGTSWMGHLQQVLNTFTELAMHFEKVSIVGISYGALLALHAAARRKVSNLVLLSPFLISTQRVINLIPESTLVQHIPSFITNIDKKGPGPINKKKECAAHIAYHTMPVKPLKSVMECAQQIIPLLNSITCPALLMHSIEDSTADFKSSVQILKELGSEDKSLITLSRSNHIITLDFERDTVENQVLQWMRQRRV